MKPFLNGEMNHVSDPAIKKAVEQAKESLSLSLEQRKELINCLPSDEEEEGEEDCNEIMQSIIECSVENRGATKNIHKHKQSESDDDDDDKVTGRKVNC